MTTKEHPWNKLPKNPKFLIIKLRSIGDVVYNTDDNQLQAYDGGAWRGLSQPMVPAASCFRPIGNIALQNGMQVSGSPVEYPYRGQRPEIESYYGDIMLSPIGIYKILEL